MIISYLMGGLGNQLFQFSAAYAYAQKCNVPLSVELGFINANPAHGGYRLDNLLLGSHIHNRCNSWAAKNFIYRIFMKWPNMGCSIVANFVHDSCVEEMVVSPALKSTTLLGYWQNEKHFRDYRTFLKNNIIPIRVSDSARNIEAEINKCMAVSLHVRRGDYVNNQRALSVHGICSIFYYKQAISKIKLDIVEPHFFVFTNDASWVKQEFGELFEGVKMTLVEGNTQEEDLWLMSQAKHHIIANSSFSWWGAWLAKHEQQIVIAPTPWYDMPPKYSTDPSLPEWIRLPK